MIPFTAAAATVAFVAQETPRQVGFLLDETQLGAQMPATQEDAVPTAAFDLYRRRRRCRPFAMPPTATNGDVL